MSRKKTNFLYGGIGLLLVTSGVLFNYYQNSKPKEPIKIYKTSVSTPQEPIQTPAPVVSAETPLQEFDTWEDSEVPASEMADTERDTGDLNIENEGFIDFSETQQRTLPETQPQEDPRVTVLKEVFPKLDRLEEKIRDFDRYVAERMTPENTEEFAPEGEKIEAEFQDYCRRIAKEFPTAVTFVTFEGTEWAYDVDFGILQDSLGGAVPTELERYFGSTSLRDMLNLPEMHPDLLQQLQTK